MKSFILNIQLSMNKKCLLKTIIFLGSILFNQEIIALNCFRTFNESFNIKNFVNKSQEAFLAEDDNKGKLSEGLMAYRKDSLMGFMDEKGRIACLPKFFLPPDVVIPRFSDGLCAYFEMKKDQEGNDKIFYGFINHSFNIIIPARFPFYGFYCNNDAFPLFKDGYAIVNNPEANEETNFLIINKIGNATVNPFTYSYACLAACYNFPEISDLTCVKQDDSGSTYFDIKSGKLLFNRKFSLAGPFKEGVAAVEVDGRYIIFINKKGEQIFASRFYTLSNNPEQQKLYSSGNGCESIEGFADGTMPIFYYDNEGKGSQMAALINKNGEIISKMENDGSEKYNAFVKEIFYKNAR